MDYKYCVECPINFPNGCGCGTIYTLQTEQRIAREIIEMLTPEFEDEYIAQLTPRDCLIDYVKRRIASKYKLEEKK